MAGELKQGVGTTEAVLLYRGRVASSITSTGICQAFVHAWSICFDRSTRIWDTVEQPLQLQSQCWRCVGWNCNTERRRDASSVHIEYDFPCVFGCYVKIAGTFATTVLKKKKPKQAVIDNRFQRYFQITNKRVRVELANPMHRAHRSPDRLLITLYRLTRYLTIEILHNTKS